MDSPPHEPKSPSPSDPLPFEAIGRLPLPGMAVPAEVAFSPNGAVVSYLHAPDGSLDRRLFVRDLGSLAGEPREVTLTGGARSEDDLNLAEHLRRERARETGLGIQKAVWARDADVLLVPLVDGIQVLRGLSTGGPVAENVVASAAGDVEDPQLSPDGTRVAYVREGDLYLSPTGAGAGRDREVRLTTTAREGLSNGLAEYVAQEEMARAHGFWWSRDGSLIAYAEVDEADVPVYRIVHQGDDGPGGPGFEDHRYPFAGGPNAKVRLGVVGASGGETTWMDTGGEDHYLARVQFTGDRRLLAEIESRDQHRLDLVCFDTTTGARTLLHREEHEVWVNLHDDCRPLGAGVAGGGAFAFVWSSERSGFRHLELRDGDGSLLRVLTEGTFAVDRVETVDESAGLVYYTAASPSPTERHLYAVALSGGAPRRITSEAGIHDVVVSERGGLFADRHSCLTEPPSVSIRSLGDGSVLCRLHARRDPRIDELGLE
ncbi:MAG: DPP IV N-terminal domain-containing protein, partial [Acidimicrobiales bacterium]